MSCFFFVCFFLSVFFQIDLKKWAAAETKEEARQVVVDVVNSPYKQGFDAGQSGVTGPAQPRW